jgi:hypothetical protein
MKYDRAQLADTFIVKYLLCQSLFLAFLFYLTSFYFIAVEYLLSNALANEARFSIL